MSFTLHSVFFTLKVSIFLGSLVGLCLGLEFMGLPNQWARYLRWDASTRSDLSFQFKTNVSTGLLLYLDDGGVCDFLCLSLVDGRVQLRFSMDCAETTVLSNKQVNDSSWHFLMVSRDRVRTGLVIDGEGQSGELRPQRPYMDVVSDLFLGGVPADIRPSALTLDGVQSMPGFKGLMLDLKYGNSEPRLLGSQSVQLEAEGPCGERPCENGGICTAHRGGRVFMDSSNCWFLCHSPRYPSLRREIKSKWSKSRNSRIHYLSRIPLPDFHR